MHCSRREAFLDVVFHGQSEYLVSNSFFFSVLKMGRVDEQIIPYDDGYQMGIWMMGTLSRNEKGLRKVVTQFLGQAYHNAC